MSFHGLVVGYFLESHVNLLLHVHGGHKLQLCTLYNNQTSCKQTPLGPETVAT